MLGAIRLLVLFIFIFAAASTYWIQKQKGKANTLNLFITFLPFLNAFAGLLIIFFCAVDLPYLDSWDEIELYGTAFDWQKIGRSVGGHAGFFPRLMLFTIGNASAWNTKIFLLIQWLSTVGSAFFIFKIFQSLVEDHSKNLSQRTLLWLATSLALLPNNAYYYLDSRLIGHVLSSVLFLIALFFSQKKGWQACLLPIVCMISLLSSAWGVITWIVFIPAMILKFKIKTQRKFVLFFIICMGISFFLYAHFFATGYVSGSFLTLKAVFLGSLDFLILLGVFVYPYPFAVGWFGLLAIPGLFLLLAQALVTREVIKKIGFLNWCAHPFGIALVFSILGGLLATIARAQHYPFESLSMKYNQMAVIFSAILLLQLLFLCNAHVYQKIKSALVSFFMASFVIGAIYLLHRGRTHYITAQKAVDCLKSDHPFKDYSCFKGVFSDLHLPENQNLFQKKISFLRDHKISLFRDLRQSGANE